MAKKILFTSLKGGVGVTTCALGLGLALSKVGEKTLIVDGDCLCASAVTICGLNSSQFYTLADYEKGACRAKQLLLNNSKESNLYLLPTLGCGKESVLLSALNEVEGLFDYVIADGCAADFCDSAVVITEPYTPSLKSADKCLSNLKDVGFKEVSLIINKYSGALATSGKIISAQEIATLLRTPLTAVIPEDLFLAVGEVKKQTLSAFKMAADNLRGKTKNTFNALKSYSGINGLIKRKMREKI